MTNFPRSPRLLKGALVYINLPNPSPNVVVFQYNPHTLTRSLKAQLAERKGNRGGPSRFKGAPVETIDLEVEIDATDQLEKGEDSAVQMGIQPQLAALEMLLYPRSSTVIANQVALEMGVIEVMPPLAPFTLFIYGPSRILPVQVTSFRVTEKAHDPHLNPVRATISLGLRVLSYNDLSPEHPGYALFLAHQIAKETMATIGTVNDLDAVAGGNVSLL